MKPAYCVKAKAATAEGMLVDVEEDLDLGIIDCNLEGGETSLRFGLVAKYDYQNMIAMDPGISGTERRAKVSDRGFSGDLVARSSGRVRGIQCLRT